jgi:hypothetical protein
MVMLYVASLLSQSHRAGVNRTTRPDDVVEVAAYSEVSRKIDNVICRIPPLPVSLGWCKAGTSTWRVSMWLPVPVIDGASLGCMVG